MSIGVGFIHLHGGRARPGSEARIAGDRDFGQVRV